MTTHPVLIAGQWRPATATAVFHAENPAAGQPLPEEFPISAWADCDDALTAAAAAAAILRETPPERLAAFLNRFADRIDARKSELVETTHLETALAKSPRLGEVELPRTTNQLRQAAAAALDGSWALPTIDARANIRSVMAALGPVVVFGPNNFPYAYNGVCGGDFAAAIAAGNPAIAKGHPSHPLTTELLAQEARLALDETQLPPSTVQMIYKTSQADGLRLVSDPRVGAAGFTGSRGAGVRLKAAADGAGKPIYLEMSSLNPVVILPGALTERAAKIAEEFCGSALMACGQMCTSPGITIVLEGAAAESYIADVKARLEAAAAGTLLSSGLLKNLESSVATLRGAGATLVTGGQPLASAKFSNTLLRVTGAHFLAEAEKLQTEAFGNASLVVVAKDADEISAVLSRLEGNLTGSLYSDTRGSDDALYALLAPLLRVRVGRLLNDKMPTGVAVTASMNHGGPFPATGHPGFTAVGFPATIRRFAILQCFDNVREHRLPPALRNRNPNGKMWRLIDGQLSQADVAA